jgi:phosphoribosylformylglycinamidine (FGAM) synthase-like enzyme
VHDVGGGGLATALAEMAATTNVGLGVVEPVEHAELFSEFPGRFVMATSNPEAFGARCASAGVPLLVLGIAGGDRVKIGAVELDVSEIERRRRTALEEALAPVD